MSPTSQAQEAIRDFTQLPEPVMPSSWTTSQPGGPPSEGQEPFSFATEPLPFLRQAGG